MWLQLNILSGEACQIVYQFLIPHEVQDDVAEGQLRRARTPHTMARTT